MEFIPMIVHFFFNLETQTTKNRNLLKAQVKKTYKTKIVTTRHAFSVVSLAPFIRIHKY